MPPVAILLPMFLDLCQDRAAHGYFAHLTVGLYCISLNYKL